MYYKEKSINGILHYQLEKDGKWKAYSIETLSKRVIYLERLLTKTK
jgi:hypothetical protein